MRYNLKQIKALSKLFMDLAKGFLLAGVTLPVALDAVNFVHSLGLIAAGFFMINISLMLIQGET